LVGQAKTNKKNPIKSGGAMMLGSEQDCYGGCTEEDQSFFGLMDEVSVASPLCSA
jgi:Pentaxin family